MTRDLVDDRAEFERLQRGDSDALAILYRRHRRPVYLAALSVLRSRSDAEEVLQDAFVTMWRRRGSITLAAETALPWLLTTARYLALNRLRAIARRRTDSLEVAAEPEAAARSPLGEALASELRAELQGAIAQLSKIDQAIVTLCLVEDLSYKQAAHRLGVTQAAVRNRLSRLRAHLRVSLGTRSERNYGHDG